MSKLAQTMCVWVNKKKEEVCDIATVIFIDC